MQSIKANADGTVSMTFSTPGRNQTVDRRPGDPLHELRRPAHARLQRRELRPAEEDGDHPARSRPQLEAPAAVLEPLLEHARPVGHLERQRLLRRRHPEHLGRLARAARAPPASSSTTRAATSPTCTTRRRRTRTLRATRRSRPTPTSSSRSSSPSSRASPRRWTGKATLSTPFLDPLLNCSYSYWKPGQYVGFSGYEGVAQGASTSPASTARRTSRGTWKAAQRKVLAQRARSSRC